MHLSWRKAAVALAVCAASILAAAAWPASVGGSTIYLTTHGSSMEPAFTRGDLALVRKADRYGVGDVVAYHSPTLDTVVLHRIVAVKGDTYVLQGDSNSWVDPDQPRADELAGKLWLHVPMGGHVVARLRQALPFGGAVLLFAGGAAATARRRRPTGGPRPMSDKSTSNSLLHVWRVAAGAGVVVLACAAVGAVAFSRPAARPGSDPVSYAHTGAFSYHAPAPPGPVYENGRVTTGDPVYLQLLSRIDARFAYAFEATDGHDVTGTIGLRADVADSNGWRRSMPLREPQPFAGGRAEVAAPFDIAQVQALVAEVRSATGVSGGTYTVSLVPEVSLTGTIAGQPLTDTFAPRLDFHFDPLQLRPNVGAAGEDAGDPLRPRREGEVARDVARAATLRIGGLGVGVRQARAVALLFGLPALLVALVALAAVRREWRGERSLIELRHGKRLVPVVDVQRVGQRAQVDVASMADLVRLAEQHDSLVLHQPTADGDAYVFTADRVVYRYLANGARRSSA